MTTQEIENRRRIKKIINNLKEEIFIELDRRIVQMEGSLSGQIGEQIEGQVQDKVEGEVERQIKRARKTNLNFKIKKDFRGFQENLQLYHKIPYGILVVSGVMLFWYGAWGVMREMPVLSNGPIALGLGALLLFITGAIYKKLV